MTRTAVSVVMRSDPSTIYAYVIDPRNHVKIDGSGMLENLVDDVPPMAVGETFRITMDREPLGDIPLGKYQVVNTVTRMVRDELFEWNVGTDDRGTIGHVYGWEIQRVGSDRTKVTNYCDWSGTPDSYHSHFPIVPTAMLQKSLDKLVAVLDGKRH